MATAKTQALPDAIYVPLGNLLPDPENARTIPHTDIAIDAMAKSLQHIGLLQPILIRPATEKKKYFVVAGNRRAAGARAAGWKTIMAIVRQPNGVAPIAMSAAENMLRKGIHPVDQWRALASMTDSGMSTEGAADALGIDRRLAQRLDKLGRLHPEILAAMAQEDELPPERYLRTISMAPANDQANALTRHTDKTGVNWFGLSEALNTTRISRSDAVFKIEDYPEIVWQEDLFAEPGAGNEFTTTDAKAFLEAQRIALAEQAAASGGRIVVQLDPGQVVTFEKHEQRNGKTAAHNIKLIRIGGQ